MDRATLDEVFKEMWAIIQSEVTDPKRRDWIEGGTMARSYGLLKQRLKKRQWIRNLKVGDIVCDCKYEHLKIASMTDPRSENIYDVQLELEDGSSCSAMNCCNSPDHESKHPE